MQRTYLHRLSNLRTKLQALNDTTEATKNSAAVAILLIQSQEQILLVRRKRKLGDPWSGQMALPGGRYEEEDGSLLHTVIRETQEEVGVDLNSRLIGRLPDVKPRNRPGIRVAPYISLWPVRPEISLSKEELVSHYWIGLEELEESYARRLIPQVNRELESYLCNGHIVWGLTARILGMLFQLIRE